MEKGIQLKESWEDVKKNLKQKFVLITDSDVLIVESKKEEMLERLQVKLGKSKEEIRKLIAEL